MRLFFLTIPKPPCPLVPYVAGGSNSIRFKKKIIHSALRGVGSKSRRLIFKDLGEKLPDPSNI